MCKNVTLRNLSILCPTWGQTERTSLKSTRTSVTLQSTIDAGDAGDAGDVGADGDEYDDGDGEWWSTHQS